MSDFISIFLTSSGGLALITGVVVPIVKKYVKERKKSNHILGLRAIAKVYNAMDNLKNRDEITRVLLVEVSNGGNTPRPGSHMYASAVNVKHDDENQGREILERYDRIKIDDAYINMCIQTQQTNIAYKIDVKDHEDCLLVSFYKTEDIKYSEVFHIHTDGSEEKLFILSIATDNDKFRGFKKDGLRALINAEISVIRNEFEKVRK